MNGQLPDIPHEQSPDDVESGDRELSSENLRIGSHQLVVTWVEYV
jgi:hypothetical protein